jgi:murein DD-endopeptidase MepM/ murein hydrolase activator NlpD
MPTTPRQLTHLWVLALVLAAGGMVPLGLAPIHTNVTASVATAPAAVIGASAAEPIETRDSVLRPRKPTGIQGITNYTVKDGDTLWSLAGRLHLRLSTLEATNSLQNGDDLSIGQLLIIPPEDGFLATARADDSIKTLSSRYGVGADQVASFNGLKADDLLTPGVALFVPSGQEPATTVAPVRSQTRTGTATGRFIWPAPGTLTQGFWRWHPGIDVANSWGTNMAASDGGRVTWAGWGAYGIYVQIDHGNGFSTLYGHMARTHVSVGQYVDRGQSIGLMGSTGRSTGPHVHFELHYQGVPQDPLRYLP